MTASLLRCCASAIFAAALLLASGLRTAPVPRPWSLEFREAGGLFPRSSRLTLTDGGQAAAENSRAPVKAADFQLPQPRLAEVEALLGRIPLSKKSTPVPHRHAPDSIESTLIVTIAGRAWLIGLPHWQDYARAPRWKLVFLLRLIIDEGLLGPSPTARELSGVGNAAYGFGRFDDAIRWFERALAADPSALDRRSAYRSLVSVYGDKGDRAGALKYRKR